MDRQPGDIHEASRQAASLPVARSVELPGGRTITVRRLSWLEFDGLWQGICALLSALLLSDSEITEDRLAAELSGAPQLVASLAAVSVGLEPAELAQWGFDDVLAAAAASVQLNFIESKGLRDFFCAAQALAQDSGTPNGS